jgi:hypothetical protein
MKFKLVLLAASAAALSAGVAQAATIPLFNTGVDGSGSPQANGSAESHYTLASGPYLSLPGLRVGASAGGFPIGPWQGDDAASAWIGPADSGAFYGPGGTYDYRLTFSLAGLDPSTASITGQWSVDDNARDILLNGVSTGQTGCGFTCWGGFSLSSGFQPGANTIDFIVDNAGGPTGLRVEMSGTAAASPGAAPEPSSWAMMLLGFGGLGAVTRARRRLAGFAA